MSALITPATVVQNPERALVAAVLDRAIDDIHKLNGRDQQLAQLHPIRLKKWTRWNGQRVHVGNESLQTMVLAARRKMDTAEEAASWIFNQPTGNRPNKLTFRECCEYLELDPDAAKENIIVAIGSQLLGLNTIWRVGCQLPAT